MFNSHKLVKFRIFVGIFSFIFVFFSFCVGLTGVAQTIPVGLFENIDEKYRRAQLLGADSSGSSYMIRPLTVVDKDTAKFIIHFLPVVWRNQFNSHHPYGMNDGSVIQNKGYQTQFSAGLFTKFGPLSIQLRPEFVFAENKDYRELHEANNGDGFMASYASQLYNKIDLPSRFGNGAYTRMDWGQSSIRLTFDPVSFGLSNENLWWGPGIRSSLLMSNNAPGFKHLTLNTSRPVNTPAGSFETQLIAGKLEGSGVAKLADNRFYPKPDDWRYISGLVFSYQPKWIPNLYIGFDRSFIVYRNDMGNSLADYLPVFIPLNKSGVDNGMDNDEDKRKRDQYFAAFLRWIWPEAKTEIYFEFGRNDHSYDSRDAIVELDHSRAYIVGFSKLISLPKLQEYIDIGVEFTQMERSGTKGIRAGEPWYAHYQVLHGYTNKGQVLGAGIGPGSNLQSLSASWVKGFKRIGVQFERTVQNNDLLFFSPISNNGRRWVDLSVAGRLDWDFERFILNAQLTYIRSLNYQYRLMENVELQDREKQDANNIQLKMGVMYNF